jgi:hypothetical protein
MLSVMLQPCVPLQRVPTPWGEPFPFWSRSGVQPPVTSFSNEKNPRFRAELMPQLTGTLW